MDVLKQKMYQWKPGATAPEVLDIPESEKDRAAEVFQKLLEAAAENDEGLMEKFFEQGTLTEEEMREWIGVDSLKFVSLDGLYRAAGEAAGRDPASPKFCDACFSGDYPITPSDKLEEGFQMKATE